MSSSQSFLSALQIEMAPGTCGQTLGKSGFIYISIKYVYNIVVIIIMH